MFGIPNSDRIKSCTGSFQVRSYSHGKLVVAICSRVSRKTVNSVGQGLAYQNSGVGLMLLGNNDC